jgi:hypothetical protein
MSENNQSIKERNVGMWATYVAGSSSADFKKIATNDDLFNRMVMPACFNQCARTDVDIVFMNEMECAYKCAITYK